MKDGGNSTNKVRFALAPCIFNLVASFSLWTGINSIILNSVANHETWPNKTDRYYPSLLFKIYPAQSSAYLISIVVPIFNKKIYLDKCMNCSLNQTDPNYEVIYVDDCSVDGSFEYLLEKIPNDSRVTFIKHNYNQGLIYARRSGIMRATGQYILSYDPDDIIEMNSISSLRRTLKRLDFPDVLEYKMIGKRKSYSISNLWGCTREFKDPYQLTMLYSSYSNNEMANNVCKRLIKRELFVRAHRILYHFYKGRKIIWGEDRMQSTAIFAQTKSFKCSFDTIYTYVMDNPDNSQNPTYQSSQQSWFQIEYINSFMESLRKTNNFTLMFEKDKSDDLPHKNFLEFIKSSNKTNYYEKLTKIVPKETNFTCEGQKGSHVYKKDKDDDLCVVKWKSPLT